jgi:hypothetical protein
MPKLKTLPRILAMVPATFLLTAQAVSGEPAARECRASPGASTPRGGHWYYRLNPGDKRHCWYLGAEGVRTSAAALPQQTNNGEPAPALPPPPPAAAAAAEAAGATTPEATPPTASMPVAPALVPVAFLDGAMLGRAPALDFATRWPADLPPAQYLDRSDAATPMSSFAEASTAPDMTGQMPETWPVADAADAQQPAAGAPVLRIFSVAGIAAIAIFLLVGWAARFARGSFRSARGDAARAIPLPRRAEIRKPPLRRVPTPTDPADDLKTSLAELMRDLRRAEAVSASSSVARKPARPRTLLSRAI